VCVCVCVCVCVSACVPICRSLWPHGLKSGSVAACFWVCGFESRRGHGFLSLVSVVCCQVEVSAAVRSLVQGRLTKCDASDCDRKALLIRKPWPTRGCWAIGLGETFCVWSIDIFMYFVLILKRCNISWYSLIHNNRKTLLLMLFYTFTYCLNSVLFT